MLWKLDHTQYHIVSALISSVKKKIRVSIAAAFFITEQLLYFKSKNLVLRRSKERAAHFQGIYNVLYILRSTLSLHFLQFDYFVTNNPSFPCIFFHSFVRSFSGLKNIYTSIRMGNRSRTQFPHRCLPPSTMS
jgi:hypothetical protein